MLKFNPKIILTSESRTTQDVEDIEIQMEGYNAVRCDSSTRHTGGVIIYVRSGLNFFISKTFVCDVYGISQAITKPTRITPDSESLIDYVLVNKNNVIANVHDSPKVTDHAVISVNFTNEFKSDCNSVKKYRNVCLDNLNSIQNELISCKWSLDSMDVNLLYKEVYSNCENIINKISPIQVCTFRNNLPIKDITNSITSPKPWYNNDYNLYLPFFKFKQLSLNDLKQIVKSLDNKFSTYELLNCKMLKNIFETIGHVILNLVNTSLDSAMIPNDLKISTVVPIPKTTSASKAHEYRPINTLPPIEKILEVAVYNQMMDHIETNRILHINQSAFRKMHSCESAIQLTLSKFKNELDNDKFVVAVFLDLKRAFETIDRNILLAKLKVYGISGNVYNWFSNYLKDRKQRVRVCHHTSNIIDNEFGIPQGTVLGPLLFILYLNDIHLFIDCEFINLFADDTVLACSDSNLETAINKMNNILNQVDTYMKINVLKLNVAKTKAMIITSKYKYNLLDINSINLKMKNETIEIVNSVKYLGVQLDNLLKFDTHFEYIYIGRFQKSYTFYQEYVTAFHYKQG
nr:unnamed protein product [Callosobruchus analis]